MHLIGKTTKQATLLCTVSLLALATDLPQRALAQSTRPAVTVDAPKPQQRAQRDHHILALGRAGNTADRRAGAGAPERTGAVDQ